MKRTLVIAACAALMISAAGCGRTASSNDSKAANSNKSSAASEKTSEENSIEQTELAYESKTEKKSDGNKKPAHQEIGYNGAKAVTDVLLIPDDDEDISRDVDFTDMFGRHVLHTGVVGLVGAPIEVDFISEEVSGGKLVFVYDPNELKGVRPDALMFMWYDEDNDNYVELTDGVLNTENCSMSIHIDKPGVYLLVNKFEWLNCWGADLADNGLEAGYDPSAQPLDDTIWSKNEDVGDIPSLKDDAYIASCKQDYGGYVFNVSTPEQLASAVYTANCTPYEQPYFEVNLMNDIDLAGYKWTSMGWSGAGLDYEFTGDVNGNGHTIKNMTINGGYHIGFIGCGDYCSIHDLNFENAYVSGANAGVIVGYARWCYIWDCHVQGVTDGTEAGGVVSIDQSSDITNCTADVIANGESLDGYMTGREREAAIAAEQHPPKEKIWLDEKGRLCREETLSDSYTSLGWLFKRNGQQVLDRNAENETLLDWRDYDVISYPGHYEVCLTAYVDGYEIPISNTLEYNVE